MDDTLKQSASPIDTGGPRKNYEDCGSYEEYRELYDDAVDPALQGSVGAAALTSKEWARWVAARAGTPTL